MAEPLHEIRPPRVGIVDVARHARVSTGTVSNVMNSSAAVSEEKRLRVLAAIEELGFSRNRLATALLHGRSTTIGLVTIDLCSPFHVNLARGAQRVASERGFSLQVAFADGDADLVDAHINALTDERFAGLLVAAENGHQAAISRARRADCAVVELDHESSESSCRVLVDNETAGYLAVRHLIDLGRRRIALVFGRADLKSVSLRCAGARRAVREAAGEVSVNEIVSEGLEVGDGNRASGALALARESLSLDAVMAVTDSLAIGVMMGLAANGVRVPDDVAVMGCDDESGAWGDALSLTSVHLRGADLGAAAAELLLAELIEPRSEHTHSTVIVEPRLRARASTIGQGG